MFLVPAQIFMIYFSLGFSLRVLKNTFLPLNMLSVLMLLVPAQILMIYFSVGLSLELVYLYSFKYVICLDAFGSRTDLDDIFLTGSHLGVF
jgi:hypothetical protein